MAERPPFEPASRKSSYAAPSRLQPPPTLKPSPSLSNLRVHSHGSASTAESEPSEPLSKSKESALNSSASSMVAMDMPDVTLVQETDSIAEHYDPEDPVPPPPLVDQEQRPVDSKQLLLEQLKRSLSNRVQPGKFVSMLRLTKFNVCLKELPETTRRQEKQPALNEITLNAGALPRRFPYRSN